MNGTNTALVAHPVNNIATGTSMKIYTRNPKQLELLQKELSSKTNRKTLYGELKNEIEIINDKIKLIQSYIKTYNNYKDLVKDFYDKFELYEAPTINSEKEQSYSSLNPNIMRWYEDAYHVYDQSSKILFIL
jgi:hypothetical protein